jgi:uncharacterized protein YecE (DUF72 family)
MNGVAERIRCGIAGWSYPDWEGYVYDASVKDQLRFIAGFVDMIEINSTFYRPPALRTVESWARRTGDLAGFFFTAKLHQDVTHGGKIEAPTVAAFRDGLTPLTERGMLKHLLAQFRYDFADTPAGRAHLQSIRDAFGGIANLTLELRHNSWQAPDTLAFLGSLGVTVANLDYPMARNSFSLRHCRVGEHAYLRLHGRNAKAWFSRDAGRDETYNYLYSPAEVDEIVRRAVELASMSKSLTLVANNHYQGKEAVNILQIKSKVTGRKVPVPPPLLKKYPDLSAISAAESTSLFPDDR